MEARRMILRPYQSQTIEDLFKSISDGNKKIAIRLPTGAGKSLVSAEIIKRFISSGKNNIFVVKRQQLVNQTYQTFLRLGIKPSVVMGNDKRFNTNAEIQICSIDTIHKRSFDLSKIDVVHYDEAWDCTSPTYQRFMYSFPEQTIHVGYSGSFGFIGNKGHTFWQDLINPVTKVQLVNEGFLVFPQVYTSEIKMSTTKKITGGDFNNKHLFAQNDDMKIYGNIVLEYQKHGNNKKAFCFGINIEHSKKIVEEFKKNGINAVHVDSSDKDDYRKKVLNDFEFGDIQVLSNVGLYGVGTDVPCAEVLICARPTQSTNLWEQMAGRVLRPYPNKKFALILDHGGNTMRLGHPINDFSVQLTDKKKSSDTEPKIKVYQCKSCFYVFGEKTDVCPMCGAQNEIKIRKIKEQKEAELKKFNLEQQKKDCPYEKFKKRHFIETNDEELKEVIKLRNLFWSQAKSRGWKVNAVFFKLHEEYPDETGLVLKIPPWFYKVINEQQVQEPSKPTNEVHSGVAKTIPFD